MTSYLWRGGDCEPADSQSEPLPKRARRRHRMHRRGGEGENGGPAALDTGGYTGVIGVQGWRHRVRVYAGCHQASEHYRTRFGGACSAAIALQLNRHRVSTNA
jgi:hypothetical protein